MSLATSIQNNYFDKKIGLQVSAKLQNKPFKRLLPGLVDDFVLTGMDKQMLAGIILVDLKKVFDILDHEILCEKTKCLSFQTSVVKCL